MGTKVSDWSHAIVAASGLSGSLAPADYAHEYFMEIEGLYSTIEAWPDTLPLLESLLAAGFPLAIATSSPRASFEKKMAFHCGILTKMSAIVTGDEVPRGTDRIEWISGLLRVGLVAGGDRLRVRLGCMRG